MLNTDSQTRNPAFSVQVALWSLAGFAGALSAGALPEFFAWLLEVSLAHPAPYRYPLFIAALLMLPALLSLVSTKEKQARPEIELLPTNLNLFKVGSAFLGLIAMMAVVRLFQVTSTGASMIFFNVYMDTELSASTVQIGALSALARLLAVPAALLTPALAVRSGNGLTVVLASLGTGLFMLPLALVPHWLAAGAGYMGVMALSSMRYPAFIVYIMELTPPKWQAAMSGAGEMAAGLGFAAMALSGGYIITGLGYSVLFLMACALSIIGSLMFWVFVRAQTKQTAIMTTQA
jgi:predicted MFS family arabinose efflux permease